LSLFLTVAGFAAVGLAVITIHDSTAPVSPLDDPASALAPARSVPDTAAKPDREAALQTPAVPSAAAKLDRETVVQTPAVPNAAAKPDREAVLQTPAVPNAAAKPDPEAVLQTPAVPHAAVEPDREAVLQTPAPNLKVSPTEIAMLLQRGEDMLKSGDIAAARLLFRRAAEAGNSEAAFKLASMFDPIVLREVGAVGFAPDVTQALFWYEKASAQGSEQAKDRIERLKHAGNR
jgi:hypothetical protein